MCSSLTRQGTRLATLGRPVVGSSVAQGGWLAWLAGHWSLAMSHKSLVGSYLVVRSAGDVCFMRPDDYEQYMALCRQERRLYLWGGLFSVVGFLFLAYMAFVG